MATILVVDDEPTNREMLSILLASDGHRICAAGDGTEALAAVKSERPALVVSDIVMPTMDGYDFVRQMRRDPEVGHTPVMFYTANYFEREARGLATACGVFHVLTKPAEPETILRTVREALATTLITASPKPAAEDFDREHLRLMTDKLSAKVGELEATKHRLTALIDISQQLNVHDEIVPLAKKFAEAARNVIASRMAAVAFLSDDARSFWCIEVAGLSQLQIPDLLRPPVAVSASPLGVPVALRQPARMRDVLLSARTTVGRPADAGSMLAVPVFSGDRVLGCLCVAGRIGGREFTAEDEQVAVSLAAQLAVACENAEHVTRIERDRAELESRVAQRTAELARSSEQLAAARRRELDMKDQFISHLSHELRGPLASSYLFTTNLLDGLLGPLSSDQLEHLEGARRNLDHLRRMIDSLLDAARLDADKGAISPEPIALEGILRMELNDIGIQGPQLTWRFEVPERVPLVLADPVRAAQVVRNLLSNAMKFTAAGGQVTVDVRTYPLDERFVSVTVEDTGCGIPLEARDRIFERLYQRDQSDAQLHRGLGLGLFICREIVEAHGGRIWIEDAAGPGTRIVFTLPIAPPVERAVSERTEV